MGIFPEWAPWLVLVLIVILAISLYLSDRRGKENSDEDRRDQ